MYAEILLVTSQLIRQELEAPTHVAITIERTNAAVFAVDQWRPFVRKALHIIETRSMIGALHDFADVLLWSSRNR